MKLIIGCFVVLALTLTMVQGADPIEKDAVAFVEGLLAGLGSELNATDCEPDAVKTLTEFDTAVVDLDEGFEHKDIRQIYEGFKSLGAAFDSLADAFEECEGEWATLSKDIKKIATQLAAPDGVIEVVIREIVDIFVHREQVTTDVKNFIEGFKSKNYFEAGQALGNFAGLLLQE